MPLHLGHVALIRHAFLVAEQVTVAIVDKAGTSLPMALRLEWFEAVFKGEIAGGKLKLVAYTHQLPHDGSFYPEHVRAWCEAIASRFSDVDVFVSSEAYGDALAEYMQIDHIVFDQDRDAIQVSGTAIRENPEKYRDYLPEIVARYYGLKSSSALGKPEKI